MTDDAYLIIAALFGLPISPVLIAGVHFNQTWTIAAAAFLFVGFLVANVTYLFWLPTEEQE